MGWKTNRGMVILLLIKNTLNVKLTNYILHKTDYYVVKVSISFWMFNLGKPLNVKKQHIIIIIMLTAT